ncbi:DUF4124 domain-containing protein [Legionella oakridgensis]|uniref:DUF4124 domain-containing protein n=2 Tax=Legionella oakridgensis TaxID=29423 RepID=W0BBC1_9GAMM|nr:DUF4124 domain-containing protein [Legionella oakridgensis]AHE67160.1 hypothetical protein Loa_01613 [Legionella oakridgensis ATCC 33761 = DSM 21215]KTD38035.1 hypothetical protein Loak_1711 [Legionella oakridgensis]STY20243.1 Uncharacterised protein [Legionella longbeachae]
MRIDKLLFCFVMAISPLHAQIYKWTDSNGNVYFSDKPHPGAEKIELPEVQTFSSPAPSSESSAAMQQEAIEASTDYAMTILAPKDQETIRNNQGYVAVNVQLEPSLKANDKLQIIFDGKALGKPQATTVFALQNINRGSHTIAVQLVNEQGDVLKTSPSVTIFMHRPRVGMVPQTRPSQTP